MPRKRLSMRQVHEVLRLKWAVGLSDRQIARSLGLSRPTVAAYVQRAQVAGLSWPLPEGLDAVIAQPVQQAGQPWAVPPGLSDSRRDSIGCLGGSRCRGSRRRPPIGACGRTRRSGRAGVLRLPEPAASAAP